MKPLFFLLALTAPLSAIELEYQSNRPVTQKSQLKVSFTQQLPGIKVEPTFTQNTQATLLIKEQNSTLPITALPVELLFTPNTVALKLESEQLALSLDTNQPEGPTFLGELANQMEQQTALTVEPDLSIKGDLGLIKLRGPKFQDLPKVWLRAIFALAGEELVEGGIYTRKLPPGDYGLEPESLIFTVNAIDDNQVSASFIGKIPPTQMVLDNNLSIGGVEEKQEVMLEVSGSVTGTTTWNRRHALEFDFVATHEYSGEIHAGSWSWTMNLAAEHLISTER